MNRLARVLWAAFGPAPAVVPGRDRLVILASKNVTRGKAAAAAVHAALAHFDVPHGAVVVLSASPAQIEEQCDQVIRDAGRTEVEPGTVTAGVRRPEGADHVGPPLVLVPERFADAESAFAAQAAVDAESALRHLASRAIDEIDDRCEVTTVQSVDGRCPNPAVAVRLEFGFSNIVCEKHAVDAEERRGAGAVVVRPS